MDPIYMSRKKRLVPFRFLPAAWGLSGKSLQRAKAEYELDGYDLDVALVHIEYSADPLQLLDSLLEINYNHSKITAEEYDRAHKRLIKLCLTDAQIAELNLDKVEEEYKNNKLGVAEYTRRKEILKGNQLIDIEVDFKYNKINEKEFNKRTATANSEPWVDVLGVELDPKKLNEGGAFTLDWNDAFIEELQKNGYQGTNPGMLVQRWFDTLCVDIAIDSGLLLSGEGPELVTKTTEFPDGRKEYS